MLTLQQGRLLSEKLGMPVYVGMRNWKPYIADAIKAMVGDGVERAVVICLAPQNSRTSVGLYQSALSRNGEPPFAVDFVEAWHDHPLLVKAFAEKFVAGYAQACGEAGTKLPVIFTAHSVPQRTIAEGDPYERRLRRRRRWWRRRLGSGPMIGVLLSKVRECRAERGWGLRWKTPWLV